MPAKSRVLFSSLSLLAAMGTPIHRSTVRFAPAEGGQETEPANPPKEGAEKKEPAKPKALSPLKHMLALAAEKKTLAQQVEEQRGLVTQRDGELAAVRQQLAAMTAERDGLKAKVTQLESEQAAAEQMMIEALEAHESTDQLASRKAAAIAAGQGIPERELPAMQGEGKGGADKKERSAQLVKEYQKLSTEDPTKAAAFYAQHEKEMLS